MSKGLRKEQIERIIIASIEKNPDLKYYIDDEYVLELINLLIEGVSKSIEENNKKLLSDLVRT
jgi:predicted house-cleaning noncanonical NTP pyrophosphatase (MazG superfamily)